MHDYYREHFDYDPPRKFGVEGYAAEANHMLNLLCPKKDINCNKVHDSVRPVFCQLNERTLGWLATVQR